MEIGKSRRRHLTFPSTSLKIRLDVNRRLSQREPRSLASSEG